eukprot:GEMP01039596.1.p1 GENE.GEMP01039596.1~~GEMP01039596.1.p1  ORF type:complete len:459 (+),score=107.06 GEMP01039596.1:137-1513(+)
MLFRPSSIRYFAHSKTVLEQTVLAFNCGSSSIKFQVINPDSGVALLKGQCENVGNVERCRVSWHVTASPNAQYRLPIRAERATSMGSIIEDIIRLLRDYPCIESTICAVGHRVVHGGERFSESAVVTDDVLDEIRRCIELAPVHNPANVKGIEAMQKAYAHVPHVAVFDTAFHHSLPEVAYTYPIPYQYYKDYALRKYGFHGTSHRYIAQTAAQRLRRPQHEISLISAHLGNGCSICAIRNGVSVDTTMGLTPLGGIIMGTRCGDIDPGVVEFVADKSNLSISEVMKVLNKESGMRGISGVSEDMRLLKAAADHGQVRSALAIEMFCYNIAKQIAAYTVATGGIPHALVFTGGIGEQAHYVRERVIELMRPCVRFGAALDVHRNMDNGAYSDGWISPDDATMPVLVIPANEELMIAKDAIAFVRGEAREKEEVIDVCVGRCGKQCIRGEASKKITITR